MLDPLPVEEELSVVLAGPFDRLDFEAGKLAEMGVLLPNEEHRPLRRLRPNPADTGFWIGGIMLFVTPKKLNIETNDISRGDRLRDLVLGILHHLTGTPTQACGINYEFFFDLPDERARDEVLARQASVQGKWSGLMENSMARELCVSGQRAGKFPGENNISIRPWKRKSHGILVGVNYHFPMPKGCQPKELPRRAAEFLENEWSPALAFAHRAAENVFAKGVSHVF
jgi:hypothetical protein